MGTQVQALHAQPKPPVYYVAEVDVTDLDGYLKEYAPKAAAAAARVAWIIND
jgi:hypothetical protein